MKSRQDHIRSLQVVQEESARRGQGTFFCVDADHSGKASSGRRQLEQPLDQLEGFVADVVSKTKLPQAQYANMNVRRKKRRGIALLIGMEKGRDGSEADRNRVESMADYLHFVYTLIIDRKASDIQQVVESILAKDVKETDECIVCCVDAHGEVLDGIHFIYDNEGDGIELLSKILKPISDCDLLAGKPKVFVVNSCREIRGGTEPTSSNSQEQNDLEGKEDCLLMYSSKLNTQSYRAETGLTKGTLFISELTYHISLSYQTTDVQDIFKKVEKKVQELAARMKVDQCPVIYSSLKKRLSWRLK
ncbi:hypothetical protein AXG93_369s1310 [Marchantia polymorpha subsp. ruderalis]|uniref:Caspase family p20 domain-containing protein n=1 Tax=Marchantia polymorpha subsp. ruderalis TaxID=1480154 RepID=A0A176VSV9_MARPO|nr:hypothetical protein AXG93_369s1310 [Marchantia polymorpha subsp. ruderalis]